VLAGLVAETLWDPRLLIHAIHCNRPQTGRWKMRRESAGHENAGHVNAGHKNTGTEMKDKLRVHVKIRNSHSTNTVDGLHKMVS